MVCARSSLDLVPEVVVSESVFGILVVKERKDEWRRKRFCESVSCIQAQKIGILNRVHAR